MPETPKTTMLWSLIHEIEQKISFFQAKRWYLYEHTTDLGLKILENVQPKGCKE